jgi:hypothetical protein
MTGISEPAAGTLVRLEGGPADLPEELRARLTSDDEYKVKIRHGGGYEHFERTDERRALPDGEAVIYRWTARTRIAE